MSLVLKIIRSYFFLFSRIFPSSAGNQAFELFQRTLNPSKRFRKRELPFYKSAHEVRIPGKGEDHFAYTLGDPNAELVFLIHGWDSNAGSMSSISKKLVEQGKRIVALDFPGHGHSKLRKSNIYVCREALRSAFNYFSDGKPFDIVSHSFGSAFSAFALWKSNYYVKNWIMLSSPNRFDTLFREFQNQIGLSEKGYRKIESLANNILNERLSSLSVPNWTTEVNYKSLILIHDKKDKILPFENTLSIHEANPGSELIEISGIGHYKMLHNPVVVNQVTEKLIATEPQFKEPVLV